MSHFEKAESRRLLPISPRIFPAGPRPWVLDAGMYEPLYYAFDAYPTVIPRVRVRGVMALFLAVSILWALIWLVAMDPGLLF